MIPLYSPADGKIISIKEHERFIHVAIFLDMFDDHVQYSPVKGEIIKQDYIPGSKVPAFLASASRNEQMLTHLYNKKIGHIYIKQIAGILYRRIVSFVKPKQQLEEKEPIGKILFGSRVDIYFPKNNFTFGIKKIEVGKNIFGKKSILGYYNVD